MLNAALRSLGVFNDRQIRFRLSQYQPVPAECDWRQVESFGWVCHFLGKFFFQGGGKCIHSMRCGQYEPPIPLPEPLPQTSGPEFPFAEWNECVESMTRELGSPAVALAVAEPPHPLPPWTLCYQVPNSDPAYATVPVLKRALFDAGIGTCHLSGGWSAFDNPSEWEAELKRCNAGDEFIVYGFGELETAVSVIRRIVAESGQPCIRLFQRFPFGSEPPYRRLF